MYLGEFSKWLMHDDQKELFEILFAAALNAVFLALIALLLWPLGKLALAFRMAKAYAILWLVTFVTFLLISRLHRLFRLDIYTHANAFVISNLAVSCFLQAGWSAFAALTVQSFAVSSPVWILVTMYLVGVLSCLIAFYAVSSFYQGHVYKFVSLPLALISFVVFSVWPASGRVIFGWFFDLF
jgi:hypothetical protein